LGALSLTSSLKVGSLDFVTHAGERHGQNPAPTTRPAKGKTCTVSCILDSLATAPLLLMMYVPAKREQVYGTRHRILSSDPDKTSPAVTPGERR
jgi:hypothetical protein